MPLALIIKMRKYGLIMKTSLQSNMAYASNFLFRVFFYAFIIFIFLQLWKAIFGSGGTISGYTLQQMIWYCICTEMVALSGGSVFSDLNTDIKGGNIAYVIGKPYNYVLYQFSNTMGLSAVVFVINVVAGITMGVIYVGPLSHFNMFNLPVIFLSMLLAILLNFFLSVCLGLSAFWLEENTAVYWIYSKILIVFGVFLPVELLRVWLQKISLLLPFSYITYGPAKLVVDYSSDKAFYIITMQTAYLVLFMLVAFFMFGRGVKKINANGG